MHMTDSTTGQNVTCTITDGERERRREFLESTLAEQYSHVVDEDDGYTFVFDGVEETLPDVATFVANESDCCSFADYELRVTRPHETTELTIRGPAGTREQFARLAELFESATA